MFSKLWTFEMKYLYHRYYKFIRYNEEKIKKCLIKCPFVSFSFFSRYMNSCRKVTIAIWR